MALTKEQEEIVESLKHLVDCAQKEDQYTREMQLMRCRKLKYYWDGFQRIFFSEVAHDWRVPKTKDQGSSYYDKPVNVYRAYLESIVAALSITVPAIRCVPEDAANPSDLITGRAGELISKQLYRDNNLPLLWIKGLYILTTEGMIAVHNYPKEDEKYGTYEDKVYEPAIESVITRTCVNCDSTLVDDDYCPHCLDFVEGMNKEELIEVEQLKEVLTKSKSRQCFEPYGFTNVKVPFHTKKQQDISYLIFSQEVHYSIIRQKYNIDIEPSYSDSDTYYERWARQPIVYGAEEGESVVTERQFWFRPSYYWILDEDKRKKLEKKYPNGVKVCMANEHFCRAESAKLDDEWTIAENPLSDFLHHEPLGQVLVNVQDIVNDMIALVIQTIEHGIPQTFADPDVLNFELYSKVEATPGTIFPAKPRTGQQLGQAFHEVKTATLSREVEVLINRILELGQLCSGALPSLFGGQQPQGGSGTAAEYSMSRAQAQQRLQTIWKMFVSLWERVFTKVIPLQIEEMKYDEQFVDTDSMGNYVNIFIKRAELTGKIGRVYLESAENMPITVAQKKDALMELIQIQHPAIMQALTSPENVPLLKQVIGIPEFTLPGQDSIEKQYEEIQLLLQSGPMPSENPMMPEMSSVQVDPDVDDHIIEAETCKRWLVSPAGRESKRDNPDGYRNVLLHTKEHMMFIAPPPMPEMPGKGPKKATEQPPINPEDQNNGIPNYSSVEPTTIQ